MSAEPLGVRMVRGVVGVEEWRRRELALLAGREFGAELSVWRSISAGSPCGKASTLARVAELERVTAVVGAVATLAGKAAWGWVVVVVAGESSARPGSW